MGPVFVRDEKIHVFYATEGMEWINERWENEGPTQLVRPGSWVGRVCYDKKRPGIAINLYAAGFRRW